MLPLDSIALAQVNNQTLREGAHSVMNRVPEKGSMQTGRNVLQRKVQFFSCRACLSRLVFDLSPD